MDFSGKALKLILEFEGLDQPSEWPGGDSGITIGIGYDLGYEENLEDDWANYLSQAQIARLKTVIGLKGAKAQARASEFKDIHINRSDAEAVFTQSTLPDNIKQTRGAFPGFDNLPLDAQGALVSLVYNRGTSVSGDRRREMLAIRDLVPQKDLKGIADQLLAMKRLWPDVRGLQRRRDAEADLVLSCISAEPMDPSESVEPEPVPEPVPVEPSDPISTGVINLIVFLIKKILGRK